MGYGWVACLVRRGVPAAGLGGGEPRDDLVGRAGRGPAAAARRRRSRHVGQSWIRRRARFDAAADSAVVENM